MARHFRMGAVFGVLMGVAAGVSGQEIPPPQLGLTDAAKLLDETLQEEKRTDLLLTKIAERINGECGGKGGKGKAA